MLATLLLSQGVPMIVAGDEVRRTQRGNNNAYCQDNDISWFDWRLVRKNAELFRFAKTLIHFRRHQPTVRRRTFLTGQSNGNGRLPDVSWYSPVGTAVDWLNDQAMICLLTPPPAEADPEGAGRAVMLLMNASPYGREFILPPVAKGHAWKLLVDTAERQPFDAYPDGNGPPLPTDGRLTLPDRSFCCYVEADRSA